jgi:uncharacterized protein
MAGEANVPVENNRSAAQFETKVDGLHGLLTYSESDGKLYLLHTEVAPALEGRGIGSALVRAAAEYAREQKLAVVPFCSFARSWLDRHQEFADLVTAN